jgi:hypothetical protein
MTNDLSSVNSTLHSVKLLNSPVKSPKTIYYENQINHFISCFYLCLHVL